MGERELVRYTGLVYDSARWEGVELRSGDIIISTPPKCGATWTQMLCALLILQTPELDRPLSVLSPWLDMQSRARREVVADLETDSRATNWAAAREPAITRAAFPEDRCNRPDGSGSAADHRLGEAGTDGPVRSGRAEGGVRGRFMRIPDADPEPSRAVL